MRDVWPCIGLALVVLACGGERTPQHSDAAPPASAALADILPPPAASATFQAVPGVMFALRSSGVGGSSPSVANYQLGSTLVEDDPSLPPVWRFGVDAEGLRVALGDAAYEAAHANMAAALRPLLTRDDLRDAVATAVASSPGYRGVDLTGAWDVDHLIIETVSLTDGVVADADGDGNYEISRTVLTARLLLPPIQVPTPADPYPACAAALASLSTGADVAAGRTYRSAATQTWSYQLGIVLHVTLEDLTPVHDALWTPTDYFSRGEREAAAYDLAVFRDVLAAPADFLGGADLAFSFTPARPLVEETLAPVSAVARDTGDVACLRQLDGWMAEPSVIVPASAAQAAASTPLTLLSQSYDATVDAADGVVDPGLLCLHDAQGRTVQTGAEDVACSTASGPLVLSQGPADGSQAPSLVTPYEASAASLGEIFACDSDFWRSLCTGRFGRGIRLCMSEWALRDQVGDYWNIHWTQSVWKSTTQTAIKASGYLVRAVVVFYMGSGPVLPRLMVVAASEGSAYIGDVVSHLTGSKIAGYSISGYGAYVSFVWERVLLKWGVLKSSANFVSAFAVDRVVDGLAQMAEVEAVGWQDYSDSSYRKCGFKFNK